MLARSFQTGHKNSGRGCKFYIIRLILLYLSNGYLGMNFVNSSFASIKNKVIILGRVEFGKFGQNWVFTIDAHGLKIQGVGP